MAITFGQTAPSQVTLNLDSLFATSFAEYKPTLYDNISESNAFLYEIKRLGKWKKRAGGAYLTCDLMYELGAFDSYDGYDELSDTPMDGITQGQYEWRQGATPITYSEKERKQNKHRLIELVPARIKQAEMGLIDGINKAILQGSMAGTGTSLTTPYTSPTNGSLFFEPLPLLIHGTPSSSVSIGNINQSTNTWWRNRQATSTATTYSAFLLELDNLYNTCSRGPGGSPTLILTDQKSFELLNAAYYQQYRTQLQSDANYPFENVKFRKAHVVFDQYVPDVANALTNTTTKGTMYFINPEFFEVAVEEETDMAMTAFAKPPKGDSKLAHILLMGQLMTSNRRKQGVLTTIARSLT